MCSGFCVRCSCVSPSDCGVCLSSAVQVVLQCIMEGQNGSGLASQGDSTKLSVS